MKNLDLPIYQRKNVLHEQDKNSFISVFKNKMPYVDLILAIMAFLLGRAIILETLMPLGLVYFIIFLYESKKDTVSIWRLIIVFIGVGAGYFSQIGLSSLEYIVPMSLLIIITNYFKEKDSFRYSLVTSLVFLLCQIPDSILNYSISNMITVSSEAIIIFLITLLSLRVLPDFLIYIDNRDKKIVISLVLMAITMGLLLNDSTIEMLGNINISRILSSYLIMVVALTTNPGITTILGTILGVLYSLSNINTPFLIGNYALAGLISSNFKKQKKIGVMIGFILSTLVYISFSSQTDHLILIFKEAAIAGLLLLFTPKSFFPSFSYLLNSKKRSLRLEKRQLQSFISERITQFSQIFNEIFNSFLEVGTVENKEVKNIGAFLDLVTAKVCCKCDLYNLCWKKSFYKTYNSLFDLLLIAENADKVTVDDLSEVMTVSCTRKVKLATAINEYIGMYELNSYWQSRLESSERILLQQLSGMSEVINKLSKELKVEIKSEEEIEDQIQGILENNGFIIKEVLTTNYNNEQLQFTIRKNSCKGESKCIKSMIPLINSKLDLNLKLVWNECGAELKKKNCICQLAPGAKYQFECGVATASSKKDISGDNYSFFKQKDGKFVTLLSDGMGVGEKAAQQSGSAVNLLEQMLKAGLDYELALQTVNSTLCLRSQEDSFATIDLLSIEAKTGYAEFTKIGSASSFIKRGYDISMVKSTSLPIGILNKIDIEPNSINLEDKDIIIMMTDGVLDTNHNLTIKEEWMLKILKNNFINDPDSLAQYILHKAQLENKNLKDDMTVLVIRVDRC